MFYLVFLLFDLLLSLLSYLIRSKKSEKNVQDKTINTVYLKKDIDEIQFDIEMGKIKSENQIHCKNIFSPSILQVLFVFLLNYVLFLQFLLLHM